MERLFTLEEARSLLPEARRRGVALRRALQRAGESAGELEGPIAHNGESLQLFSASVEAQQHIAWFQRHGAQVKGLRPLLLDFPTEHDGEKVLLCWVEPEEDIGWYHREVDGFAGRRAL